VVSLFCWLDIGLYLCLSTNNSTVKETVMTLIYMALVTPMMNHSSTA
jgi:olfactory receptor